jgi:hypothetical protein
LERPHTLSKLGGFLAQINAETLIFIRTRDQQPPIVFEYSETLFTFQICCGASDDAAFWLGLRAGADGPRKGEGWTA